MEAPINPPAAPAVPAALKPGVISSYGNGWTQLWKHFLVLFLIGIIYFVISMIFGVPQWLAGLGGRADIIAGVSSVISLLGFFYSLLIVNPIGYGENYAYLKAARGEEVEVQDMFAAFKNYWNAVFANILVGIIVVIGFILIIVPGIIFACKLAFVPYLVVDRKMSVMKAINESWHMTHGHAWKVFLVGLLGIPVFLAGLVCLGVGVIISIMWIQTAIASLYHAVSKQKEAGTGPAAPPVQPQPSPIIQG